MRNVSSPANNSGARNNMSPPPVCLCEFVSLGGKCETANKRIANMINQNVSLWVVQFEYHFTLNGTLPDEDRRGKSEVFSSGGMPT